MAFGWFCLAGIAAAFLFDILRLLRFFIPHSSAAVYAEDLIWSVGCFLSAFFCVVRYAGGVVRWFYLAGFFGAMLLWFSTISPLFLRFIKVLFGGIFAFFGKLFSLFVRLARKLQQKWPLGRLIEKLFSKNTKKPIAKEKENIV